jgi:hypothetical protein
MQEPWADGPRGHAIWFKSTTTDPYNFLFTKFVSYQSLEDVFPVGGFNAQPSSHQGQDFHLDVSGINLLEVPRPHRLQEYEDIGHYNALCCFLGENLSFFCSIILNGINKL